MKPHLFPLLGFLIVFTCSITLQARSVHRRIAKDTPTLEVSWQGDKKKFKMSNYRLDPYPFFSLFDKDYLEKHNLPSGKITFRNNETQSVESQELYRLIEELMKEIQAGKKSFSHFTILQKKDYNRRKKHGLIILKFNDYPFVLKLFIETPASFVNPFNKGLEPMFFFFLGNGINRHLSGFTRIKNREIVGKRLEKDAYWSQKVAIPRKWFWVPPNTKWLELTGYNMGSETPYKTYIPGTYCIIADFIQSERQLSLVKPEDTTQALALCNFLDLWIDPHLVNFMIEKETGKFVIVDTEHFPSFVGLKEVMHFDNYAGYYTYLTLKGARETYFQTKSERKNHIKPVPELSLAHVHL